jgi:hypothetical protein
MAISSYIIDDLRESRPKGLSDIGNALWLINNYYRLYNHVIEHIMSKYSTIDCDKVEIAVKILENDLSNLKFGARLVIFDNLSGLFIGNYLRTTVPYKQSGKLLTSLNEMRNMLFLLLKDVNMRYMRKEAKDIINESIEETEYKVNRTGLNYGEKWLVYSILASEYIKQFLDANIDMIENQIKFESESF